MFIPAAQYLRSSTESQQYSFQVQKAVLAAYTAKNNFTIVKTYTDAGKADCPLRIGWRLPHYYKALFSGTTHFEFLCRQAGVPVHYCAETFLNDGRVSSSIMKSLKRIMAAEFSRELSVKVTSAMRSMVTEGLWPECFLAICL